MHGGLCKHLGIDSSTDHPDRYSNLCLNACINRHVHAEYLKLYYSIVPLAYGILFYIVLTSISTTSGLWSTGNVRKYQQIDVYIYQCVKVKAPTAIMAMATADAIVLAAVLGPLQKSPVQTDTQIVWPWSWLYPHMVWLSPLTYLKLKIK